MNTKHALARICSLQSNNSLFENNSLNKLKKDIIKLDKDFLYSKKTILEKLHNHNLSLNNKKTLNAIQNIRRSIFNDRNIKTKDLNYLKKKELTEVAEMIYKYQESSIIIKEKRKDFSKIYKSSLYGKRIELFEKAKFRFFENGLLLSSQPIFEILKKKKEISLEPNKKQRKLEKGLLKYITRSILKPTPFSSFTTINNVSFGQLEDTSLLKTKHSSEYTSYISVNSLLFWHLKKTMERTKAIYPHLYISLNPSIRKVSNKFEFLINKNNSEYFQKLEVNETLELVKNKINSEGFLTFQKLLSFCLKNIDAKPDVLSDYLYKLTEIGFIEFSFFTSGMERDWVNKLHLNLKNIQQSKSTDVIIEILLELENARVDYENNFNFSDKRKVIIDKAFKKINNLLKETQKPTNEENIKEIFFNKKLFFLEDVKSNHQLILNEKSIDPILQDLSSFLFSFKENSMFVKKREELFNFFINKYENESEVSLLEFYEKYYRSLIAGEKLNLKKDFIKQSIDSFNIVEKEKDEIEIRFNTNNKMISKKYSSSLLFQVVNQNKENPQVVVNAIGIGYGKMFSRYLYMFDQNLTEDIFKINEILNPEYIYSEINDTSFFNANLHPPLFSRECIIPGVHTSTPHHLRLYANNLSIKKSKESSDLFLIDSKTKKRVMIHDSCFQAAETRSNLFSFLINFTDKIPSSYNFLIREINDKYKIALDLDKTSFCYPRIYLNTKIILQRKFWIVNKSMFPNYNLSDSDFFIELNSWRLQNNIPSKVFITLNYKGINDEKFNPDDRKPQYIDFESPLFISILFSFFNKTNSIKVTEALPDIFDSINYNDSNELSSEFLIQWYYGKENK